MLKLVHPIENSCKLYTVRGSNHKSIGRKYDMKNSFSILTQKCTIRDIRLSDDEQIFTAMTLEGVLRLYNGSWDVKMYSASHTDDFQD